MIHSIFLLNSTGEVIIEKHYRGTTPRSTTQTTTPITPTKSGANISLTRNGLTLLATMQTDTAPIFVTEFLSTLADILTDYFGELNEHAIKDNFITVYELLDEMLDNGTPATLEPNALKELIHPPSMLNKVFETLGAEQSRVVNAPMNIPWRRSNVRHAKNEVFVDVTETIDAVFKPGRSNCRIEGSVRVISHLSGLPEITMRMRGNAEIDDISLHHAVRPRVYDGCLKFVPPDGGFEVMRYIIRNTRGLSMPVDVGHKISLNEQEGSGNVSITLTPRFIPPPVAKDAGLKLASMVTGNMNMKTEDVVMDDVVVRIPFGGGVVGVSLSANYGTVSFGDGVCIWVVGGVQRGKVPALSGKISIEGRVAMPPLLVQFRVPGLAVSGMGVESLELSGERYNYYKGLKCISKAGLYEPVAYLHQTLLHLRISSSKTKNMLSYDGVIRKRLRLKGHPEIPPYEDTPSDNGSATQPEKPATPHDNQSNQTVHQAPRAGSASMTDAERRHEQIVMNREETRIKEQAKQSYKQKIDEFNKKLAEEPDHYDLFKTSFTK